MYLYLGIWKQMSSEHKMRAVKLQKIQNLLGKATCPLLYHCVQTDPAKNVWTRAYLIPEQNGTVRK